MKKLVFLLIAAGLLGCTSSSRITSSWKKPKFHGNYNDIMVVAMTGNVEAKATIESNMATALVKKDVIVSKSLDIFPISFTKEIDRDAMMKKIRRTSSKAILTVSLIKKETVPQYVPGTIGYAPINYGFSGYFNYWYPTMYSPGYYEEDQIYYMETNVYDVKTENLVWTAQSETYNPSTLSGFSQELANIIADKLIKDGTLRPGANADIPVKEVTSRNKK